MPKPYGRAERASTPDHADLATQITAVHAWDAAYRSPRIAVELNDGAVAHERVSHKRVARVMREHAIAGIRVRRRVRTTISAPDGPLVPDLLERDFTATEPNTLPHASTSTW